MNVGVKKKYHLGAGFQSLCNHKLSEGFTEHLLCVLPLSIAQTTVTNFRPSEKRRTKNTAHRMRPGEIEGF